ncbi:MAG: carbon-nitrogen hydrolase [Methanomassiliicoccus sp.]|nr:carbon-nitrogen hydrolase [Methanomassiliicoccus sp.]
MSAREVTIGLVQMSMAQEPEANLRKAIRMIGAASDKGAQVVCLPELFATPYFPQYDVVKGLGRESVYNDSIPGPTTEALSRAAAEARVVLIGGSIYERAGPRLFNTAAMFDEEGRMLGIYRKTHIPHDEDFYEQSYFDPGDTGFQVFPTTRGCIGPMICYDQWFPEAARCNALRGAEMVFYPTAIGTVNGIEQAEGDWQQAWENVMRGHAIANGMVVAACNRVGVEDKMEFWGGSFVIDAFGRTLARGSGREEIVLATVDLEHGESVRKGWRFFHNRRPECYRDIAERK